MAQGRIGLLPLYLKLYDDLDADGSRHRRVEQFARTIATGLARRGLEVVEAPVCRIEPEFSAAVASLEAAGVDALVTLHLAYSPSLESAGVLAGTRLPILVLDTTPTFSYGPGQEPGEISHNHGIHGVQDMCSMLVRNARPFLLEAGHWERSDVLDRVAALVPSARMAAAMRRGVVGTIGGPFAGMGDFAVSPSRLSSTIGARVKSLEPSRAKALVAAVKAEEVRSEIADDLGRFQNDGASAAAHERSARLGLAIRRWIEEDRLTALTFNFLEMKRESGYPTAPFLEMSKAMARGIGYAGEGDVLTALLVGAIAASFPDTSFSEMFCPDWEGNSIFLSHMGEVNWRLLDGRPRLREMDYPYSPTDNPAVVVGRFKPGPIAVVNLGPVGPQGYRLIIAPGEMLPVKGPDRMDEWVHGWFRPACPVAEFLAEYSRLGGTHHLAIVYAGEVAALQRLGALMGWDAKVVR